MRRKNGLILCLILMSFVQKEKKHTVFSIGDSTMAQYDVDKESREYGGQNYPIRGWMMAFPAFFTDKIQFYNGGLSGRSSKSYRDEGHWKRLLEQIKAKDYVFIQFAHNDESSDTTRHTDPQTTYRANMMSYVNETRAKGAYPVLVTSIAYRSFDSTGKLEDVHRAYTAVAKEIANEMNVPLIDLNRKTNDYVQTLGEEKSKALYLYIEPGLFKKQPEGLKDDTHLNEYGAQKFAALAVEALKEIKLPIAKYLK